jgi:hypothetical protein
MEKEEFILTVAIFGHGWEDLLVPFPEPDPIGDFYKNRVRVFSQACVPDMPSVTSDSKHKEAANEIRRLMQGSDSDTLSLLEPYMSSCKKEYLKMFKDESMRPLFDERLFEQRYSSRSCGTMTYLANKTFSFPAQDKGSPQQLQGIVLLDVRLKKTSADGEVEYERLFDAPRTGNQIVLTTNDGLLHLLKTVLRKKAKDYNAILQTMKLKKTGSSLTEINLGELFELLKMFNYVNVLDYTCRVCSNDSGKTHKRLRSKEIEDICQKEQKQSKKQSRLQYSGGKRTRRTIKKLRKN